METSTSEAMIIGTYVFIFIAALTTTIYLFTSIYNYSELAYQYGKQVPKGSLISDVPVESEIIVSGSEVISYFYNMLKRDTYAQGQSPLSEQQYNLEIWYNPGGTAKLDINTINTYKDLIDRINLEAKFSLKYESVDSAGVAKIVITQK